MLKAMSTSRQYLFSPLFPLFDVYFRHFRWSTTEPSSQTATIRRTGPSSMGYVHPADMALDVIIIVAAIVIIVDMVVVVTIIVIAAIAIIPSHITLYCLSQSP